MTTHSVEPLLAVPETVAHKTENLDWANIPPGRCYLEFRPDVEISLREHVTILLLFSVVSALAVPLAWCLGRFLAPCISGPAWAAGLAILGVLLAAVHQLRKPEASDDDILQLLNAATLLHFAAPLFLWVVVLMASRLSEPVGAFIYLFAIAIPAAIVVVDRVATHAVYWITANTQVDHATALACREDWRKRFFGDSKLTPSPDLADDIHARKQCAALCRVREFYFTGVLWLLGALLMPDFILLASISDPNPKTIGLQLLIGSLCGLLLVSLIRAANHFEMVTCVWKAIVHWLFYGNQRPLPPWVFQSPCGGVRQRRFVTALAIGLISVAIAHLGAKGTFFVLVAPTSSAASATTIQLPTSLHQDRQADDAASWTAFGLPQWPWLALAAICYSLLPIAAFFLSCVVCIGPVILSYHNALEN